MNAAVELIDKDECPFCWRVRLALEAQGRDYRRLDHSAPEVRARWAALSPQKTVPVLIDGDLVLTDSQVILEYLDDTSGGLLPEAPGARALVRNLVVYADAVLGVAVREVVFEKRGRPEAVWNHERIRRGMEGFHAALPHLEERLEGKPHFGGSYSMADCALIPRFALAAAYGLPLPDVFPGLREWFDHARLAPCFAASAPAVVKTRSSTRNR